MHEELAGAVFKSDSLFEYIYPKCPQVHKVLEYMAKNKTLGFNPKSTTSENESYDPFRDLLNDIKEAMAKTKLMERSVYKNTKFEKYNRPMAEGTGKDSPIRPNLISRSSKCPWTDTASRTEVDLCVEVKDDFGLLVSQAERPPKVEIQPKEQAKRSEATKKRNSPTASVSAPPNVHSNSDPGKYTPHDRPPCPIFSSG